MDDYRKGIVEGLEIAKRFVQKQAHIAIDNYDKEHAEILVHISRQIVSEQVNINARIIE